MTAEKQQNGSLKAGKVEVPDVLQMRENEVAEAARLDDRL